MILRDPWGLSKRRLDWAGAGQDGTTVAKLAIVPEQTIEAFLVDLMSQNISPGRRVGFIDAPQRVRITKQHRQVGGRTRRNSSSDDEIALAALDGEASPRPALALSSAQSQLALAATAVLWGTNPVCLRYLDTAPHPPSAALVTSVQSAAAAGWLSLLGWALALAQAGQARRLEAKEGRLVPERQSGAGFGPVDGELQDRPAQPRQQPQTAGLLAAAELGCWMFGANAATVIAFQQTSASRGAFLIRLTAVFTPFVALAAGQRSGRRVWLGSALAFVGGLLISFGQQSSASAMGPVSSGDLIMTVAALLWSCQTVRLGQQANRHSVQSLAVGQMTMNALLCGVWWTWDTAAAGQPLLPDGLGSEWQDPWRWAALLWPAFGPWGLGSLLQLAGQQSVSAARTQIILASDPVWATIFAGLLLGSSEQQLGTLGWTGAALILTASLTSRDE